MGNRKILFIGSFKAARHGYYGGVNFACRTLKQHFNSRSIDIVELDTTIKDISRQRVITRLPGLLLRSLKFAWLTLINKEIKNLLVLISAGNSYLDKLPAIFIAWFAGKRIVVLPRSGFLLRDFEKKQYAMFIRLTYRFSTYIICQSNFWESYFLEKNIPQEKLVVVENWVPDDTLHLSRKLHFKPFNKSNEDVFKMVFVSRIEKDKGIDDILYAAEKLKPVMAFEVNVFGAGRYLDEFLARIKAAKLEKQIKYKGWLNREKMQTVINKHHLALFPSRFEGYPNAMLDYIFSKVPVLASNIPSVTAVGEELATYYTPGDISELVQQILYCKQNHDEVVVNAQKLYDKKCAGNNIDHAFNALLPLLS